MKSHRSVTSRTVMRTIAAMVVVVGAAVGAGPASAAEGTLAGTWVSVDTDGSNQTLTLHGAGNPSYSAFLRDDFTTAVCGGPPAKLVGTARAAGDVVFVQGTLVCLPGGNPLPGVRVAIGFAYDAQTDTLTDDFGVAWDRAG